MEKTDDSRKPSADILAKRLDEYNRLMHVISALNEPKSNFMFEIDYRNPAATLKQIKNGKQGISFKMIEKIKAVYPFVNIDYLTKGIGDPLNPKGSSKNDPQLPLNKFKKQLPFFSMPEAVDNPNSPTMKNWKANREVYYQIPDFANCTAYIKVKSNMMKSDDVDTSLKRGDIAAILLRPLNMIPDGAFVYLVTKDMYLYCKLRRNEDGTYEAITMNENYPDHKLKAKEILEVFTIEGFVRAMLD